jgi:SAM-dependent methyltransferase
MSGHYVGSELELFAAAANWKAYFARVLAPFVGGRVLEVGAGIGSNIWYLSNQAVRAWTSLEPDGSLAAQIDDNAGCDVVVGTIAGLDEGARFETILYIDVLEHIADDRAELAAAAAHLAPGGHLVVLAPAHPFLFTPFDAAIGHYRRYTAASLAALSPPECRPHASLMLDSAGFFASLANRTLLAAAMPTAGQIAFWDKVLVPASRVVDRLTGHRFGKSVVAVWQRQPASPQ